MLEERKILESERNAVYVKSTEGSRLTGTVEQNKNVFDKYPELIKEKFNALVDSLTSLGIDTIVTDLADRYTKEQTNTLVGTETQDLVSNVTVNTVTGVITVYKKNGTVTEIDTALEKVPATFELVTEDGETFLKVTNIDGTTSQTSVTSLMNVYVISAESETILVTNAVSGVTTTYTLEIKEGSIKNSHLSAEVMATLEEIKVAAANSATEAMGYRDEALDISQTVTANTKLAQDAAIEADENAILSKSFSSGGTGVRENEDTDNSYYYSRQASLSAQEAKNYRDEAQDIAGGDFVPTSAFNTHVTDTVIHVTEDDRLRWDNKMDDTDIDCGDWDNDLAVAAHNEDPYAHSVMSVDGNEDEASVTTYTLEEHQVDEEAHQNLVVDGNS